MTVELIFTHIPKCSGISFLQTLYDVYGRENVVQIWDYLKPYTDSMLAEVDGPFWSNYGDFRRHLESRLANVEAKVLHGHMPAWCLDGLFPGVPRVTWLRYPLDQILSRVFHYRKEHLMDAHIRFSPWELARQPWFRNCQFFYTSGMLSQFAFVGLVEYYDRDFQQVAKLLGWPRAEPYYIHRTEHEDDLRSALRQNGEFCDEMKRLNYRDFALYDWRRDVGTV